MIRALVVSLLCLLALTSCASLPRSGSVGEVEIVDKAEGQISYSFNPAGPVEDASPESIVQGFLTAATGIQDNFATARSFLTEDIQDQWNPHAKARIYSTPPEVTANSDGSAVTVDIDTDAVVNDQGVYEAVAEKATETFTVELTQVADQWRISSVPDGISLDVTQFRVLFVSHILYFYDPSFQYGVPDPRWMLNVPGQDTMIVQRLLAGPANYLDGAVATAFPESSAIAPTGVTVTDGTAQVELEEETFTNTTDLTRQRMQQQLELSLIPRARVSEVLMTVDNTEVETGDPSGVFTTADTTAAVASTMVGLDPGTGELVLAGNAGIIEDHNFPSIAELDIRPPALSHDTQAVAFATADRDSIYVATTQGHRTQLFAGQNLRDPSWDAMGWVWSAETQDSGSTVLATHVDGAQVHQIRADWLADQKIVNIRVSPDTSRMALVLEDDSSNRLVVAGIMRDSQGTPLALTEPVMLQTSEDISSVLWYSTAELLVGQPSGDERVELELTNFTGNPAQFKPLLGLQHFTSGAGRSSIYAQAGEKVYLRVGNNWREHFDDVTHLAFPG